MEIRAEFARTAQGQIEAFSVLKYNDTRDAAFREAVIYWHATQCELLTQAVDAMNALRNAVNAQQGYVAPSLIVSTDALAPAPDVRGPRPLRIGGENET